MGSATPDLRLPSQLQGQGITALWLVPSYTAWWTEARVWKTYPRLLPGRAPGLSQSGDLLVISLARYRYTTKPHAETMGHTEMMCLMACRVCIVDTGGHSLGIVVPHRRWKWSDTDGHWCRCRAIHGTTAQLHWGQSSGTFISFWAFISNAWMCNILLHFKNWVVG